MGCWPPSSQHLESEDHRFGNPHRFSPKCLRLSAVYPLASRITTLNPTPAHSAEVLCGRCNVLEKALCANLTGLVQALFDDLEIGRRQFI
jgi:hypothetical protein